MKKIISLALLCSASLGLAELPKFVVGAGVSNFHQSEAGIDINIPVGYVSAGCEVALPNNDQFVIVPELRLGTGITSDDVYTQGYTVDTEITQFYSLNLRAQYEFTEKAYIFGNVAYTYSEAEASLYGYAASADSWDLGAGAGIGYNITEQVSAEVNAEFYDGTTLMGGAVRFTF